MRLVVKSLMLSLPHSRSNQAELLEVGRLGDGLLSKVLENLIERAMEGACKVSPETGASIAKVGVAEPVLFDLLEAIPVVDQSFIQVGSGVVSQELQVLQNLLMERLILGLLTVEQQERIDEQRKIRNHADVKRPVGFDNRWVDSEIV